MTYCETEAGLQSLCDNKNKLITRWDSKR